MASSLEMPGGQIIAQGNVEFTANADGLKGASLISGGRTHSTSNMNLAFCGAGIEHFFVADCFRLLGREHPDAREKAGMTSPAFFA